MSFGASRDADAGDREGELYAIYVAPERIGSGLGRGLLVAAEDELERDFERATLWVFEQNVTARAFYERQGWRVDSRPFDPDRWGWARSVRYGRELTARRAGASRAARAEGEST